MSVLFDFMPCLRNRKFLPRGYRVQIGNIGSCISQKHGFHLKRHKVFCFVTQDCKSGVKCKNCKKCLIYEI